MFEQIARLEAWAKANGPQIRRELELVAETMHRTAEALEKIADSVHEIRGELRRDSINADRREDDTIEGTAIEEVDEPANP